MQLEEHPPLVGDRPEELRPQVDVLLAHQLVRVRPIVGGQLAELLHAVDLAEDVLDLALLRERTAPAIRRVARRLLDGDDVTDAPALGADLVERTVGDDASAGDDDGARARGFDLGQVVGREHDCALLANLLEVVEKLGLLVGVEVARRLVEDENRRVVNERLGQADALPITVR